MVILTAGEERDFSSGSLGNNFKRGVSEGESKSVVEVIHPVAFFLKSINSPSSLPMQISNRYLQIWTGEESN